MTNLLVRTAHSALPALLPLVLAAACEPEPWQPSGVGNLEVESVPGAEPHIALDGDQVWAPDGAEPDAGDTLAVETGEPRVFYLYYSGYGDAPKASVCPATTPKFTCSYGGAEGVVGCQKKVQTYLDKWYADFNIVFTLNKPTSGAYYAEVITASGDYCGLGGGVGGVAPGSCSDGKGGTCYAFHCGGNAKSCAVIIAQEQAHLVGLAHTESTKDLLYPSVCSSCDGFEDRDNKVVMGTCRATQNSYQLMKTRIGGWPGGEKPSAFGPPCEDKNPPRLVIDEPADGATVGDHTTIKAHAEEDCSVLGATIEVGGWTDQQITGGPWTWNIDGLGTDATVTVTVTDGAGKTGSATLKLNPAGGGTGGGGGGGDGTGGAGGTGGDGTGGEGGQGGEAGGDPGEASGGGCSTLPAAVASQTALAALGLGALALMLVAASRRRR